VPISVPVRARPNSNRISFEQMIREEKIVRY
jgi:hypothetical protein